MSRTSEQRLILGMTRMGLALVLLIALAAGLSGVAIGLLIDQRDSAEDSRDAVAGQAQQLADCVNDPATSQRDCEKKADEVVRTIDKAVPGPAGAAGAAGSAGTAGRDGTNGTNGTDGPRGRQGRRGFIGPVGPDGPPGATGADGTDGANGTDGRPGETGPTGAQGPSGERGATGADGAAGPPGADGTPGRGIRSVTCDADSQQFVVTFTDDTTQNVEGSDCVASLIDPAPPNPER